MASHRPSFALTVPLLSAALALCACAQGNFQSGQTATLRPATVAQAPAAQPAAPEPPAPAPQPQPVAQTAAPPEPDPEPEEAMTRERASGICWMRYDRSRASLEARMKLVDKCIDEKMKAGR